MSEQLLCEKKQRLNNKKNMKLIVNCTEWHSYYFYTKTIALNDFQKQCIFMVTIINFMVLFPTKHVILLVTESLTCKYAN